MSENDYTFQEKEVALFQSLAKEWEFMALTFAAMGGFNMIVALIAILTQDRGLDRLGWLAIATFTTLFGIGAYLLSHRLEQNAKQSFSVSQFVTGLKRLNVGITITIGLILIATTILIVRFITILTRIYTL